LSKAALRQLIIKNTLTEIDFEFNEESEFGVKITRKEKENFKLH
jgi:hypothetical protein